MREAIQGTQVAIKAPHGMEGQSSSHQRAISNNHQIVLRGNHRLIRGQSSSHQRAISGNHQIVLRGNHHLIRGAAIIISFSRTSSTSLRVPSGSRYGTRKSEMPAAPAGAFGVRARSMCTWQWGERGPLRGERGPSNAPSCAREHTLRPAGPLRCQQRHSGAIWGQRRQSQGQSHMQSHMQSQGQSQG